MGLLFLYVELLLSQEDLLLTEWWVTCGIGWGTSLKQGLTYRYKDYGASLAGVDHRSRAADLVGDDHSVSSVFLIASNETTF